MPESHPYYPHCGLEIVLQGSPNSEVAPAVLLAAAVLQGTSYSEVTPAVLHVAVSPLSLSFDKALSSGYS